MTKRIESVRLQDSSDVGAVGGDDASTASSAAVSLVADYSVFDDVRDSVYSEVATVISLHERRPYFLVSLIFSVYPHSYTCGIAVQLATCPSHCHDNQSSMT